MLELLTVFFEQLITSRFNYQFKLGLSLCKDKLWLLGYIVLCD